MDRQGRRYHSAVETQDSAPGCVFVEVDELRRVRWAPTGAYSNAVLEKASHRSGVLDESRLVAYVNVKPQAAVDRVVAFDIPVPANEFSEDGHDKRV